MNENMNLPMNGNGRGVMMAAVVGAALGAGVALLFAPCSGRETRGWLGRQRRTVSSKATNAFEQGRQVIQKAAGRVSDVADAISGREEPSKTTNPGIRPLHT